MGVSTTHCVGSRGSAEIWLIAKTGQSLIASPAFQNLPEASTSSSTDAMDVDAPVTEETSATRPAAVSRKYVAPVDPASGDLIPEGVVYLRLLLLLANIDAGKIEQVSHN